MLGDSSVLATSGDVAAATSAHEGAELGAGGGSNSGEEDKGRVDEGDRSYGGNRWPRQETLALLGIRSDMDAVFRDSSLKGPLWEEVSRKLAELGYHRSAKKCREKFENVFKYHKRTKEGRTGKADGKTYRFFEQLEALENHPSLSTPPPKSQSPMPTSMAMPWSNPPSTVAHVTVPSMSTNPMNTSQGIVTPSANPTPTQPAVQPINPSQNILPLSFQNMSANLFSSSTSSSTASEEFQGGQKRKRKWRDFFERLTREVIRKQEELQKKFLETIEKRELERMAREEAWRMQEMARINREHEFLVQERSTAAAKDAAVIAFLQKVSGQQNPVQTQDNPPPTPAAVAVTVATQPQPQPQPQPSPQPALPRLPPPPPTLVPATSLDIPKRDNGENFVGSSSSRWPKAEVHALIGLRTNLDIKYQENGPKGPLWEEISSGMRKLGYNRSSKRCKEKWENINKYFKKVKESNKKRPEDSKTCPYFHQLDALYKEKNKTDVSFTSAAGYGIKPVNPMEPLMVQPEQQWPPQQENQTESSPMEDNERDQNQEDDEDGDSEEEDEGGGYEVVANKSASLGNGE